MPFSSVAFLFAFLPLFLVLYNLSPGRLRNLVALFASLVFYAWGAPRFLLVLVAVSALDYVFSRALFAWASPRARAGLLALAVTINLSLLFYFKYANFVVHEGNRLLSALGRPPLAWETVALPMGVSFIVFEEISYLVDVYRYVAAPARRFSDYALFLSLFPHSIAGPIFRWKDLEQQFKDRAHRLDKTFGGFVRFSWGLAKKVLIANHMASVADQVFALDPHQLPTSYAWAGLLAYTLQIYFDFSGYSDMAIGLGRMMGFSFKENFNAPYGASSITDFWRRWHISLSTWLRDYLYIPLGGNRVSTPKRYRNLVVVFLLCGLWHGANWTFLAWGAYHGAWLVIERSRLWQRFVGTLGTLPAAVAILFTFVRVMLGWVLFRAESIPRAFSFFAHLLWYQPLRTSGAIVSWGELVSNRALALGLVALAVCWACAWTPAERWFSWLLGKERKDVPPPVAALARLTCATGALGLSVVSLVNARFNPFIYFRF
jgi:alginate O-acetyltransferase complex protein AlgI